MSTGHWFRMYDDVLDNPKVQRLPGPLFKSWVNVLALSSKNGGRLPKAMADVGFGLRISEREAGKLIADLHARALLDRDDDGYFPHDWEDRQYKSDTTAERMKRYRERNKNRNDDRNALRNGDGKSDVLDTDTDSEQNREDQKEVSSPPAEAVATKIDPPEPVPKPKVQKRTQIPDACPSMILQGQAVQFWGVKARLDLVDRLADQVAQFRDHHLKNGSLMADWDAAWRTWYRKALEFTRMNGNGRKESTHEQGHRIALELIAELAQSDTATDHRPHHGARAALPQISDDRRRTEVVAEDLLRRSGQ